MTTLVYRYGLHAPHEGGDLVREQIWRSHRFRNTLIEIERGRRAAVRQLELDAGLRPAVLALEQASAIAKAAHATIAHFVCALCGDDHRAAMPTNSIEVNSIKR